MLGADLLRQVERVRIRTRRLVDGLFAGEYHSVFKGRGMEFADVREYAPGDDVRTIDWNVTARMGQPFVKKYVEERELTVFLLVDLSGSTGFGSLAKSKAEVATEACAVLSMSALRNNDKVGLILFTDRVELFIPPQKGKHRAQHVIRALLSFTAAGNGTDIGAALDYLNRVARRRAIAFLLSDFLDDGYERPLRMACQRHDMVPVTITDPKELSLPSIGIVSMEDPETGRPVMVDTSSVRARDAFERAGREAVARRRRAFESLGLDSIDMSTDSSAVGPLLRFFHRREQRLSQGR